MTATLEEAISSRDSFILELAREKPNSPSQYLACIRCANSPYIKSVLQKEMLEIVRRKKTIPAYMNAIFYAIQEGKDNLYNQLIEEMRRERPIIGNLVGFCIDFPLPPNSWWRRKQQ